MQVDVVSSFECPWCYLGSLRLRAALAQLQPELGVPVTVRWWAHRLMPAPRSGHVASKKRMYLKKFGADEGKVDAMVARFSDMYRPFGATYSVEGDVGDGFDAMRLCEFARRRAGEEAQWAVADALFQQYHSLGRNLADHDVLVEAFRAFEAQVGGEAGVRAFLASDELRGDVEREVASAGDELGLAMFMGGVPHVLVRLGDMRLEIPGAQDVDYFVRMLRKVADKHKAQGEAEDTDDGEAARRAKM